MSKRGTIRILGGLLLAVVGTGMIEGTAPLVLGFAVGMLGAAIMLWGAVDHARETI